MLVFHNDLTGPRDLVVSAANGTAFPTFSAPFVVVSGGGQPPRILFNQDGENPPPSLFFRR
jgi:hypothetical protein